MCFQFSQTVKLALRGTLVSLLLKHGVELRVTVDNITQTWQAQEMTQNYQLYGDFLPVRLGSVCSETPGSGSIKPTFLPLVG